MILFLLIAFTTRQPCILLRLIISRYWGGRRFSPTLFDDIALMVMSIDARDTFFA